MEAATERLRALELREAAAAGILRLVNELLLGGVAPFESDEQATTALHRAAEEGRGGGAGACGTGAAKGAAPCVPRKPERSGE